MAIDNGFQEDLERALRKHRPAMVQHTPAEILAVFMIECLESFERGDFKKRREALQREAGRRIRPRAGRPPNSAN